MSDMFQPKTNGITISYIKDNTSSSKTILKTTSIPISKWKRQDRRTIQQRREGIWREKKRKKTYLVDGEQEGI